MSDELRGIIPKFFRPFLFPVAQQQIISDWLLWEISQCAEEAYPLGDIGLPVPISARREAWAFVAKSTAAHWRSRVSGAELGIKIPLLGDNRPPMSAFNSKFLLSVAAKL